LAEKTPKGRVVRGFIHGSSRHISCWNSGTSHLVNLEIFNMTKHYITVRLEKPGFHCWPEAPDRRAYLRRMHRHLFKVTVTIQVSHGGRAVEFHDLRDWMWQWFTPAPSQSVSMSSWATWSCEQMAQALLERLHYHYNLDFINVEVSEDGEASGLVAYVREEEKQKESTADVFKRFTTDDLEAEIRRRRYEDQHERGQ
jgi:hypothetical protein